MILHVLRENNKDFDYMVGSTVAGFDTMVRLTETAPVIILEGDEYLSSPIDRRPKFHLYQAHIGLISGIAWDHINVFPTFENYVEQFAIFAQGIPDKGSLIWFSEDAELQKIAASLPQSVQKIAYGAPEYKIVNGKTVVRAEGNDYELQVFGKHNLCNLEGAREVCQLLGVNTDSFYKAAATFTGAGRRLELVKSEGTRTIYRDFAHSPSKLKATVAAVKEQFPERKLVACMELHTFSSLSENFLNQYDGTMNDADVPVVYFNPQTLQHKKLNPISSEQVRLSFNNKKVVVFTNPNELRTYLTTAFGEQSVLLMMSSGTFDGLDLKTF